MTLNDDVRSANEKTLFSSPASYPYFETITKTFLASADFHNWKQEDILSREPIHRLAICLNINGVFLGKNRLNAFHYRKFGLAQIYIYRNGLPVADSSDDDKRLYFNTISDLAYIDNGHGIKLSEYPSHFLMVFVLMATVEVKFSAALPNNVEFFLIGEKTSTIYVDSARRVSKNHILTD